MHSTSLDLLDQSQAVAYVFLDSQEMVPIPFPGNLKKHMQPPDFDPRDPKRSNAFKDDPAPKATELETPSALGRPHGLSSEVSAGWAYGNPLHRHLLPDAPATFFMISAMYDSDDAFNRSPPLEVMKPNYGD
jgi:hypothetical protein